MYLILFSVIGAPFIKVPPVEITVAKGEDLLCSFDQYFFMKAIALSVDHICISSYRLNMESDL